MSDTNASNTDAPASQEPSHFPVVDDTPAHPHSEREVAFDRLRIENYAALRMGAIRARSWWLIAFCMAALTILDLLGKAAIYIWVFHQVGIGSVARLLVAGLLLLLARHALRRAADFKREIDHSSIPEPTMPPDFSTLSDGSDRWKDLENVR